MITTRQLSEALYGTWRLLKFDPRGLEYFEVTLGGFWRSFLVAAITAPPYLAHAILMYPAEGAKLAFAPYIVVYVLSFVLGWVMFPFAMLYIGDLLNRRERYFWLMVPYNWVVQIAITLPYLVFFVLADLHILPAAALEFVQWAMLLLSFVYGIFITRFGLQVGFITALGVTILNLLLTLIAIDVIGRI